MVFTVVTHSSFTGDARNTAFGRCDRGVAVGLKPLHDHGSLFVSEDYQNELRFLGIESSRLREPKGNGVTERFIRTLREQLLWVRSFATVEGLRLPLLEFNKT